MSIYQLEEYIESGDTAGVERLLGSDRRLSSQLTSYQVSPVILCCYFNNFPLAAAVAGYAQGLSMFEAASLGEHQQLSDILQKNPSAVNSVCENGFTALGLASQFGKEDSVRVLLLNSADPNLPSQNGYNVFPLHSAVGAKHDMVSKMLIEGGADVNAIQLGSISPLHLAAENGNIELLITLLEAGADVTLRTDEGKTASDRAAEKGHLEIAKILAV